MPLFYLSQGVGSSQSWELYRRSSELFRWRIWLFRTVCLWVIAELAGSFAQAATVGSNWTSATSGIWNSDSNWTNVPMEGGFPNNGNGGVATYDAVVNATGVSYNVNLASNITVEDLLLNSATATISHTAGTFTATGAMDLSAGTYSLNGGTISNTTINVSGSGALSLGANSSNLLTGVTLNGNLTLHTPGARTQIGPGTFFAVAHLSGDAAELNFAPGSIVKGNILFEGNGNRYLSMNGTPGTMTIAPGSIVRTESGAYGDATIGKGSDYFGAMTLLNQGTISSQVRERTVTLSPANFTNSGGPDPGTLSASNGGFLTISATNWNNAGSINVDAATAHLGGTFDNTGNISVMKGGRAYFSGSWSNGGSISVTNGSTAEFGGTWSSSAGTTTLDATSSLRLIGNFRTTDLGTLAIAYNPRSIRMTVAGVWDNSAQSFTFNTSCRLGDDFYINGGCTIIGGTLNFTGDAALLVTANASNVLTGVSVNGDLKIYSGARAKIEGGTTFRTAYLGGGASALTFEPGYTLTGTVEIHGSGFNPETVSMNGNPGTFTVGPTGIIRTNSQGRATIGFDGFGAMTLVNQGTLEAINGGILNRPGGYTQTAGVTRVTGGTINVTTANDSIQIDGGTLEGYGSIVANVSASGIIDPKFGSASGLAIGGDLSLGTDAELRISLGGTTQGTEYDFLSEAGTVPLKLDGTLKVEFANGFEKTVTSANTFTILASNHDLTGAFDNVASGTRLNTADGFGSFLVTYSGQSVVLSDYLDFAFVGFQMPKATFAGIISGDTPDLQGSFSVKTTATGGYTARIKLGPKTASISGQFDENFHVDETFTYRLQPFVSIDIHLIMDLDPTGERIIGSVQSNLINYGNPAEFTVYQVFKYTTRNPAPQAGRFTGLFTKLDGTSPEGTGVVTASVSKSGKVKLIGVLPDGSKISTGGSLSPGGVFPIFQVLYSRQGAFAGFAQLHDNQRGDTTITVGANTKEEGILWVKTGEDGFAGRERLILERYTPPAQGKRPLASLDASNGAARFSLTGGGLASTFDKAIRVSTSNRVSVTDASGNDEDLKISLSASTGLLTGSVALDSKRRFNLVVLQESGAITGFFGGSTGPGNASITPAP